MSRKPRILDHALLDSLYSYNPENGQISLKKANQRSRAGFVYSARYPDQYIQVTYGKGMAPAHRVAWVLMTGEQPEWIDHINGAKWDNRWVNLRSVTRSQNMLNRRAHRIAKGRPGPMD